MTAFCTTACKKRKACRTPHHAGSAGLLSGGQTSPDYNSTVAAPKEPNNQGYSVLLAGIFEADSQTAGIGAKAGQEPSRTSEIADPHLAVEYRRTCTGGAQCPEFGLQGLPRYPPRGIFPKAATQNVSIDTHTHDYSLVFSFSFIAFYLRFYQ